MKGSIKYITPFLANFDPLPPPVTLCHTSRDLSRKYVTHLGPPPRFLAGLVQKPGQKPLVQILSQLFAGFLSEGFARGSFVWKALSGVVFVRSPFCQNTSVTTES